MKKLILIITMTALGFAVPAYKGEITFTQNDGTSFTGHLHGDEYFSWIKDKEGQVIVFNNQSKNYELAKLKMLDGHMQLFPSGIKVSDAHKSGATFVKMDNSKIKISDLTKIWKEKRKSRPYHH